MKFKGLVWLGIRTEKFNETLKFYRDTLGLPQAYDEPGFAVFDLPNGDRIEIFSDNYEGRELFNTGPVVGFEVDDIEQVRLELEQAGIEFIGPIEKGGHSKWSHFRGPDGNIYELKWREKS